MGSHKVYNLYMGTFLALYLQQLSLNITDTDCSYLVILKHKENKVRAKLIKLYKYYHINKKYLSW